MPKIPAQTPYLASRRKRAVCGDWMVEIVGLKLVTHQPVIEPVSALEIAAKRLEWPAETRIRQPEIPTRTPC